MIDKLRERAKELGLAAVGVAPATDEVLNVYDWARSVVVAAVSYLPPDETTEDDEPRGLVARVARSSDYHHVLGQKLAALAEVMQSECAHAVKTAKTARTVRAAKTQVCVDTNPLPERKLAVLGGIGWRGKNGSVFVEGCGSYAALGEIVTDLDLPLSTAISRDQCGTCTRCIDSCPTGAITAPFQIDPSRCLSELTQRSGVIPIEFREVFGNRVYGCDVCQEVCPQNAGIEPSSTEFARKVYPRAYPELLPLMHLTADQFKRNVRDTSIGWIRRARLRRNAAVALGNLKCELAVPALAEMLDDESPVLRVHAAWSLGEIGSDLARAALEARAKKETEQQVIEEITSALSKLGVCDCADG